MIFFNKKKKIVLEAYAPMGKLAELFPPVRTEDAIPKWFQKLPAKTDEGLTTKHCPGIKDLFSKGIIIPAWADYNITLGPDGITDMSCGMPALGNAPLSSHPIDFQAHGAWPNHINLKFNSPWVFWCSEPIDWLWVQPVLWQKTPQELSLVPGITEFKYQSMANVLTLTELPAESKTISIKAGTPLAQLVPLTEREWELKVDVITPEIYTKKIAQWDFSLMKHAQYQQRKNILNGK